MISFPGSDGGSTHVGEVYLCYNIIDKVKKRQGNNINHCSMRNKYIYIEVNFKFIVGFQHTF
jgi:hypothetical protein